MMTRQYANHYIASLARAEQRRGNIPDGAITTGHTGIKGFTETPIQEDPPRKNQDQAEVEICPLTEAQLRDAGAVTAEVVELREGSHFIKLAYHIGNQKRTAEAFCSYASALKTGDELYIMVKERGRQQTIIILGLADRPEKEGNKCMTHT